MKRTNYTVGNSSHFLPQLSCDDVAMILISVPCIMICHDLDKGTMANHDLARLTMILASVACLRSLGNNTECGRFRPRQISSHELKMTDLVPNRFRPILTDFVPDYGKLLNAIHNSQYESSQYERYSQYEWNLIF